MLRSYFLHCGSPSEPRTERLSYVIPREDFDWEYFSNKRISLGFHIFIKLE